jgi:hypothetical protein
VIMRKASVRDAGRPASSRLDALTVDVETGSPIHVLAVGHERELALSIANGGDATAEAELEARFTHADGESVVFSTPVRVAPRTSERWTPPAVLEKRGGWTIDWTLTTPDGGRRSDRLLVALLEPTGPQSKPPKFLFSVCGGSGHPGWDRDLDKAIVAVGSAGIRVVRGGVGWEHVQQEPGQWQQAWIDWYRQAARRYREVGAQQQFLLCYTARWAAPKELQGSQEMGDWLFAPPDLNGWRAYVRKMATEFKDDVGWWEVWNEADLAGFWPGTCEQYLELLRVASEELRTVAPHGKIMHAGFALLGGHGGRKDPDFARKVTVQGRTWFDIMAWHMHGEFEHGFRWQVDGPLAELRQLCNPPAPLYFNETAVNLDDVGERGQASQLAQKLLYAWGKGAIGYTWFKLQSGKRIPVPGGDVNWGLLTEDWYPHAAYAAYNTITGLLSQADCTGMIATRPGRHLIGFANAGDRVLAAWDESAFAKGDPLVIDCGRGSATAVDLWGNRRPLAQVNGQVVWDVGTTPSYLLVVGGEPKLAQALVYSTGSETAWPGDSLGLAAGLRNPDATARTMELQWRLPAALQAEDPPLQTVPLAAGAAGTARATVQVPRDSGLPPGARVPVVLAWRLPGTPWSGEVPLALRLGLVGSRPESAPTFTLASRANLVNLNENVPQRGHLMWKGADDLAAKTWLWSEGAKLRLRVEVSDDIHVGGTDPTNAWAHDSIQFACAIPGQTGWWELDMALGSDGKIQRHVRTTPTGFADPTAKLETAVKRRGSMTTYDLALPLAAFGIDTGRLKAGIAVNLVVNDDDGEGREGWMQLASGIADRKDPLPFPTVRVE